MKTSEKLASTAQPFDEACVEVLAMEAGIEKTHEIFMAWWLDHHEDSRFFNEMMTASPDLAMKMQTAQTTNCKCGGAGWLWSYELDYVNDATRDDDMTKYSCDGEICRKYKEGKNVS